MLDIKKIREETPLIKQALRSKGANIDIDNLLQLDSQRKAIIGEVEELKAQRNQASKNIGQLKKAGKDATEAMTATRDLGEKIAKMDDEKKELEFKIKEIMLSIPNLPHSSTPLGTSEKENIERRSWGGRRDFNFKVKSHLELIDNLKIMDFKRAARMSGSGFPLYLGKGATLERALINYMLDFHIDNGFEEVIPPIAALPIAMEGTSQLPKMKEDMYYANEDDLYFIPTAEVTITNIHREETLLEDDLPKEYVGYTPCFRREAGSYGKDTRGLLRVHQFNKVEMVKYTKPEDSYSHLEKMVSKVEEILKALKIPYRVLELCSGDLSFGAAKCYDIETWSYAENKYLEASSVSNFEDFQARRMNLKFRRKSTNKPEFLHTLNGSGLATSRLMVSILENYQNEDGSITVPEVLRPYTKFDIIS